MSFTCRPLTQTPRPDPEPRPRAQTPNRCIPPATGSLPDWDGSAGLAYAPGANYVGYLVQHPDGRSIYIGTNPQTEMQPVYLPQPPAGTSWVRVLDTAQPPGGQGAELFGPDYDLQGKATLVLEALKWIPQFGSDTEASKCKI